MWRRLKGANLRKDWILIIIVGLILIVGLGLFGFLKVSKKEVVSEPLPAGTQAVGGTAAPSEPYFDPQAKVSYFYSELCHWCIKEKEVLSELSQEGYKVKPMNVGENPDLWKQYNISGTPTFIGENGDRLVGYQEKEPLKVFLDAHK